MLLQPPPTVHMLWCGQWLEWIFSSPSRNIWTHMYTCTHAHACLCMDTSPYTYAHTDKHLSIRLITFQSQDRFSVPSGLIVDLRGWGISLLQVTCMGLNESSLGKLGKEQKASLNVLQHPLPPVDSGASPPSPLPIHAVAPALLGQECAQGWLVSMVPVTV